MFKTRKQVVDRNKRLIEYRIKHPDMTVRAIAKIFHITHARVVQITKPPVIVIDATGETK